MTDWLKNYALQHFIISFELATFVVLMISIISVAFVESIDWINGKLLITPHARDTIGKSAKKKLEKATKAKKGAA